MGVNPASFAHRCVLVVLPMPGGPVIITPRKTFIPFFPGFLKLAFKLSDLGGVISGLQQRDRKEDKIHQSLSHCWSFSTCPLLPQISLSVCGAYRSVQSCVLGSIVFAL